MTCAPSIQLQESRPGVIRNSLVRALDRCTVVKSSSSVGDSRIFFPIAPCLAWDKLVEVVSLFTEFHACHNFISITTYTLISRFNSLDLVDICIDKRFKQFLLCVTFSVLTSTGFAKSFHPITARV